jgi:hypothetical protein
MLSTNYPPPPLTSLVFCHAFAEKPDHSFLFARFFMSRQSQKAEKLVLVVDGCHGVSRFCSDRLRWN